MSTTRYGPRFDTSNYETSQRGIARLTQLHVHDCSGFDLRKQGAVSFLNIWGVLGKFAHRDTHLCGEHLDVVSERLGRADVVDDARFSRSARRQLRLLENQRKQREEWVSVNKNEHKIITAKIKCT